MKRLALYLLCWAVTAVVMSVPWQAYPVTATLRPDLLWFAFLASGAYIAELICVSGKSADARREISSYFLPASVTFIILWIGTIFMSMWGLVNEV